MKYFLLVSFLVLNDCHAQNIMPRNIYEKDFNVSNKEYKGNVKKVTIAYHTSLTNSFDFKKYSSILNGTSLIKNNYRIDSFAQNGNQIFTLDKLDDSLNTSLKYFSYDSTGSLVKIVYKKLINDTLINEWLLIYNSSNKLINCKIFYKGELVLEQNYTYDKKGYLDSKEIKSKTYYALEKVRQKVNKTIVNAFDINGKKFNKQEFIEDDTSNYCKSLWFSNYNDIIQEDEIRQNKKLPQIYYSHFKTRYKRVNELQLSTFEVADLKWSTIKVENDEHNNITKILNYDELKNTYHTTIVKYKYDLIGNIIEILVDYQNGYQELTKYNFEYY